MSLKIIKEFWEFSRQELDMDVISYYCNAKNIFYSNCVK